jgi:hypothetical protein
MIQAEKTEAPCYRITPLDWYHVNLLSCAFFVPWIADEYGVPPSVLYPGVFLDGTGAPTQSFTASYRYIALDRPFKVLGDSDTLCDAPLTLWAHVTGPEDVPIHNPAVSRARDLSALIQQRLMLVHQFRDDPISGLITDDIASPPVGAVCRTLLDASIWCVQIPAKGYSED